MDIIKSRLTIQREENQPMTKNITTSPPQTTFNLVDMEQSNFNPWLFISLEGDLMIEVFGINIIAIWRVELMVEMIDNRQGDKGFSKIRDFKYTKTINLY